MFIKCKRFEQYKIHKHLPLVNKWFLLCLWRMNASQKGIDDGTFLDAPENVSKTYSERFRKWRLNNRGRENIWPK